MGFDKETLKVSLSLSYLYLSLLISRLNGELRLRFLPGRSLNLLSRFLTLVLAHVPPCVGNEQEVGMHRTVFATV